jgi:exosortase E/protease (VPEID-CTERM system)
VTIFSAGAIKPEGSRFANRLGAARWGVLAAILVAEVIGVTLRFDGHQVLTSGGNRGLSVVVDQAHFLLSGSIAVASATLIFGGFRLRDELRSIAGPSLGRWSWRWFAGHTAAAAVFFGLSCEIFEGTALRSGLGPVWVGAWALFALASFILLLATALPPAVWIPLARRGSRVLLVGLVIGSLALGTGLLTRMLWDSLASCTFWVVHLLLQTFSRETICLPSERTLGTPDFTVTIALQCSGYEGIGLIWALLGAYLWFARRDLRFPRAWLLIPLGTLVIWLANAVRIAALIAVGTYVSPKMAAEGFHSQAGWLAFNAVGLGLVAVARRTPYFRRTAEAAPEHGQFLNPTAAHLMPLLGIVAAAMIGSAFSDGRSDVFYGVRIAAALVPLWIYRRAYSSMRWSCSWQAFAIGIAVFALWMALEPSATSSATLRAAPPAALGIGWTTAWLAARVLGSVVTVPIAEELAFRGYLSRRLIAADFDEVPAGRFTWLSFVASSLAFGVLHDRWLAGTLAGMLYALAYYRRGSMGDAVAAHATTNAMIAAYVLATGSWALWT